MPFKTEYAPKKSAKQIAKEQKAQRAADAARLVAEERAAAQAERNRVAQAREDRRRAAVQAQGAWINTRIREWNTEINAIVTQVLQWRDANPDRAGINAGNNGAIGTCEGGTDNPLTLAWPTGAPAGTQKSDAIQRLPGIDSSDSGLIKVRRRAVLVHLR